MTIAAGATTRFAQSLDLSGGKLWSPESPYIYNACTKIIDGSTVGDDYVTPFGIRDLQVSAAKGMTINGVPVKLRGACLHHTMIPTGAVVPEAMWVRVFKASGTNSIRTSIRLFLERDRNHPSVVLWSYGNEVATSATGGAMPQYEYDMSALIVPFAKSIDSSRLYTHAVANGFSGDWAGYAKLAQYEDVVGVNYSDGGFASMISF